MITCFRKLAAECCNTAHIADDLKKTKKYIKLNIKKIKLNKIKYFFYKK